MERTFIAVKPDGVRRGIVGEVIKRFEQKTYKLVAMKLMQVTPELASKHYAEHVGKPFYEGLIKYITSAPIVAMVWEGVDVVEGARHIMGATKPNTADVGSIRADFGQVMNMNIVHGSDSPASAEREISLFFNENEFCDNYKSMYEVLCEG